MLRRTHVEKVEKWLSKVFPLKEVDYLLFSGGAARFIQQKLEGYCNCYRPISPASDYQTKHYKFIEIEGGTEYEGLSDPYIELVSDRDLAAVVREKLDLSPRLVGELSLDIRLVDAYGIFEYLLEMEKKYELKQREAAIKAKATAALATVVVTSSPETPKVAPTPLA